MLRLSHYSSDILHDISMELALGEHLTIIGANGTGKSTLARVLSGLIESGCVTIGGRNLAHIPFKERKKYINYIPSQLEIYDPYLCVEEFLSLSSEGLASSVDGLLERLHASHLAPKRCSHLSSGESALVLIASALLRNADFTIYDEPTSNLDPVKTKAIYHLLASPPPTKSHIIITHDLNLAKKLGYKILSIHGGEVEYFGSGEEFFTPLMLERTFGESLKLVEGYVVGNL